MSKVAIEELRDDFALLIEAGFVAVKQLDEVSAARIFQAAQLINSDSTAPEVGLGYIALNKLDLKAAAQHFETVLSKEPESHLAQVFLAICFLLNKEKRQQGEELIKAVVSKTDDPTVKTLGETALEWAEKDLKKLKAPFFTLEGGGREEKEASELDKGG